jgi:predicted RNA binding protein YcfA (HicA-like mRNA interferase family)
MMKRYTKFEFNRILESNGFTFVRQHGGHLIYKRNGVETCVIPQVIQEPIARRLIKEHKLILNRKECRKCGKI